MLIWNYWPGRQGGAEWQCRKLAGQLASTGHPCTVVTHCFSATHPLRQMDGGSRVVRIGLILPFCRWLSQLRRQSKKQLSSREGEASCCPKTQANSKCGLSKGAHRVVDAIFWTERLVFILGATIFFLLNRQRFDVIHVHESHWMAGFGAWVGSLFKIPVVCKEATFPALEPLSMPVPFRKHWDKWRRRCRFIAMNASLKDELIEAGIRADRIVVNPNGVHVPEKTTHPECGKYVLYIGNFSQGRRKAFDILFDAWRLVVEKRPDARLVLLGGGDNSEWLRYCRENNLTETVRFEGFVSSIEPFALNASMSLLPSRLEGMSNALLEAQSYGVPSVVSDIMANTEIVENEVNGLVVPLNDSNALAEAILRLLDEPDMRMRMGRTARKRIIERYSLPVVANALVQIYGGQRTDDRSRLVRHSLGGGGRSAP